MRRRPRGSHPRGGREGICQERFDQVGNIAGTLQVSFLANRSEDRQMDSNCHSVDGHDGSEILRPSASGEELQRRRPAQRAPGRNLIAAMDAPTAIPERTSRRTVSRRSESVSRTEMMTVSCPSIATNCRLMRWLDRAVPPCAVPARRAIRGRSEAKEEAAWPPRGWPKE